MKWNDLHRHMLETGDCILAQTGRSRTEYYLVGQKNERVTPATFRVLMNKNLIRQKAPGLIALAPQTYTAIEGDKP